VIDNDVMVLQNCTDFLKCLPGSYSETCVTSFHDGSEVMSIKVEAVTEEEDPLLITFPGMKAEHEVSCISFVEDPLTDCACSRDVLLTPLMCQVKQDSRRCLSTSHVIYLTPASVTCFESVCQLPD
jgi:hypothetical protein